MLTQERVRARRSEQFEVLLDGDHDEVIASDGERSVAVSILPDGWVPGERRPCWRVDDHLGTVVHVSSYLDAEQLARTLAHQLLAYRQTASDLAQHYAGDGAPRAEDDRGAGHDRTPV